MEVGGGSESEIDNWKRKCQIEILENIYAVEPFPSQEFIAELSAKLGLSVQQLKVWFQYKRQIDQGITIGIPLRTGASTMPMVSSIAVGTVWGEPVSGLRMFQQPGVRVPSYGNEGLSTRLYDQLPWTIQQSQAIAAVEAQLGGPLIENGPVLGFKFDPLPPGAFHTPIEPAVHCNPGGQSHRAEQHGGLIKAAIQTSLQYQFTQGESSSGVAAYGPHVPPRYYSSPTEAQGTGIALSGGSSYVHGTQLPISGLLHPQGRQPHISPSLGSHVAPQSSSRLDRRVDTNFGGCSITGEENSFMPSETQAIRDNRLLARNWKSKDANVGRKGETQEKRLTDDLNTLRQKKEEQMRKQDRGKLKQKALLSEKFLVKKSNIAKRMKFNEELHQKKQAAMLKTVKETLELIEDKQLELIELAYFIRVLHSISTLESETLQRLRSFGDKCGEFPPKSVCSKKPFRAQPWIDSDKNVTNLLMDLRLLGQVHIVLLRSIIKDSKDAANSGGGNPRIVEGAYARDFNISSWQRHLNPLTWPEILRQFALSAGFGPELKKRSIEPASSSDESKGDDETDASASLPNEVAAENAASATVATFSIPGNTVNEKSDGEQWVRRITEGEYCDLSVEERLDALVALISVATEGNSIRVVLKVRKFSVSYYSLYRFPFTTFDLCNTFQERIEAASAMKKEMKAEAQLNMHRLNEQNVSNSSESEFDQNLSITATEHSSSLAITGKYGVASSSFAAQPGDSNDARNLPIQESSANPDNLQLLCLECTADKSLYR